MASTSQEHRRNGLSLGSGILDDLKGRRQFYIHDWKEGGISGLRILAPSTYIFLASVLPALAFGQQLVRETGGLITGVNVLIATGVCGAIQAVFGGQPLLIVGVAEPIVLLYVFMYKFAKNTKSLGHELYLAWTAWVCVWASIMIIILALANACKFINRFTRFSGELFGALIAVLFAQEAVIGWKEQFEKNDEFGTLANVYSWRLFNGMWGLLLGMGLLYTCHVARSARSWHFGVTVLRSFMADYGPPLMVLFWSFLSFSFTGLPDGIPHRLPIPNIWNSSYFWGVTKDMGKVPLEHVASALIPALVITILFYFDHGVSSLLAQTPEMNLQKPSAYNYDFLLLGIMTLFCGLIGIPPVNGVLPQAPLHTKSLAILKREHVRAKLTKPASRVLMAKEKEVSIPEEGNDSLKLQILQSMLNSAQLLRSKSANELQKSISLEEVNGEDNIRENEERINDLTIEEAVESHLVMEVSEQRVSGLLQSCMVLLCLGITPALRKIPTAVISGYFFFMAIESLQGSQFWERTLLLVTDPKRRAKFVEESSSKYIETVPFHTIVKFTVLQLVLLVAIWALTFFAGVAGALFPLPIIALVPLRIWVLPRFFPECHLEDLDNSSSQEVHSFVAQNGVDVEEEDIEENNEQ